MTLSRYYRFNIFVYKTKTPAEAGVLLILSIVI